MTLIDHLEELRHRLLIVIYVLIPATFASYAVSDRIRALFVRPAGNLHLVYLSPTEALTTNIKLAFFLAVVITTPVLLYQVWAFIAPGLRPNERAGVWKIVLLSTILFLLGMVFAYVAVLPLALRFMLGFAGPTLTATLSYSKYVSFVFSILLSFGIIFELPVAILFLVSLGLVSVDTLRTKRKYAVFTIFVIAAVLTPPDVLSQMLMAGPLLALYEVSLLVARVTEKRKRKAERTQDENKGGGN